MSTRAIVNVATTEHTRKGQERLAEAARKYGSCLAWLYKEGGASVKHWPAHTDTPYAFKVFALKEVAAFNCDTLIWCDACILPVRSLEPAWEKIERDGYLLMRNGFSNYEWTADSAYPDLFSGEKIETARLINRAIPHTVGGFFGLSMRHEIGRAFLAELYRLASETRAFCGPWINANFVNEDGSRTAGPGIYQCGPADVRGHRHDQTAMSVIAWRLGMTLTDCPEFMIYGTADKATDPRTCVVADGSY